MAESKFVPLMVLFGKVVVPATWTLLLKAIGQPSEAKGKSMLHLGVLEVRIQ